MHCTLKHTMFLIIGTLIPVLLQQAITQIETAPHIGTDATV